MYDTIVVCIVQSVVQQSEHGSQLQSAQYVAFQMFLNFILPMFAGATRSYWTEKLDYNSQRFQSLGCVFSISAAHI